MPYPLGSSSFTALGRDDLGCYVLVFFCLSPPQLSCYCCKSMVTKHEQGIVYVS